MFLALKIVKHDRDGDKLPVLWQIAVVYLALIWTITTVFLAADLPKPSLLQTIVPTASFLLLAGFAVAVFKRSYHAIELACWIAVVIQLVNPSLMPLQNIWPVAMTVWLAAAILLAIGHNRLFVKSRPLAGAREIFTILRICIGLLLLAENVIAWVQPLHVNALVSLEKVTQEPAPYSSLNPTFITLGSSPANLELSQNRPFSRILSERFRDNANFRFFNMGGADSSHLVKLLRTNYESPTPPDAVIVYAGFQDINQSALQRYLRQTSVVGTSPFVQNITLWFVRDSALFNFMVRCIRRLEVKTTPSDNAVEERQVIAALKPNIETIISMARQHDDPVFLVTPVLNARNVAESTRIYTGLMYEYYRSLPARYNNVILVDFARAFEARYPDGALPTGEPFEMRQDGSGQMGDPFHLDAVGHKLIADTLEPEIRTWLEKWHTAK